MHMHFPSYLWYVDIIHICNNFIGDLKDLVTLRAYVLLVTGGKAILVYKHSCILGTT